MERGEQGEYVLEQEEEEEEVDAPVIFYVDGAVLEQVEKFKYLGSMETDDAKMDTEILRRIQQMMVAYNKYDKSFFRSPVKLALKVRLFNMVIVTNGLYGCQAWNVTQQQVQKLEGVYFKLVRRLFHLNKEEWGRGDIMGFVQQRGLRIYPLEWRMIESQLRYIGHQVRIGKCTVDGQTMVSQRTVGRSPHTMLIRGQVTGAKISGGEEQSYKKSMIQVLEKCRLIESNWYEVALAGAES